MSRFMLRRRMPRGRGLSNMGYGRRSRGRGNLKMRLMMAAVLAIVALASFYMNQDVNEVTGEKQRVSMSEKDEIALGLHAKPEITQQHGGLYPNQAAQDHVDIVGARLLRALDGWLRAEGGDNPYPFEFHLLADQKTVNAFALPGGQVFVTYALYSQLETEGQLVGVVGHEIGHVLSRHGAQRLAKQRLTQGLVGAAGVAGGDAQSAQLAAAVGQMINMKYGRGDELESDRWGVRLMTWAGYDPNAMIGVMDVLERASGSGGPPEFMSTHPKPANRREYIREVIATEFPNGLPENLRP